MRVFRLEFVRWRSEQPIRMELPSADKRVAKILGSGDLGSVFRAPVLTTATPLREALQQLGEMDGGEILPSSSAKIERAKALFAE